MKGVLASSYLSSHLEQWMSFLSLMQGTYTTIGADSLGSIWDT